MISDIRAKHGKDSVDLRGCGKFTLAEDLSDIKDITSIDLSGINSLEGEPFGSFFCVPVRISRNIPYHSFRCLQHTTYEQATSRCSRAART